ncbi:hypothetical protein [Sphingobium fluviale]|uniref:Uncharacterized protein n=1 Tax=Sphingobium fluviale TaxID=2506423 RepID=A0A4Q1KEF7_9SPHN|nr:hypothetical protein [Sphingobium fluviale]RXR27580.1 hypothetical protein EQG66_11940 [Sphingobium fluviale]
MPELLKLRVHITEPWDFARQNEGREELTGWTYDQEIDELEEWEIELDAGYELHAVVHTRILVSARYVGEHLSKVLDAIVGFPVRIAHRINGEWHYAMAGMLSVRREKEEEI